MAPVGCDSPKLSELLWQLLLPATDERPIFWIDPEGVFSSLVEVIDLQWETEPLTMRSAFQLRVLEDGKPNPLSRRLFYVRDVDSLEPIAELVRCFGVERSPTLDELLKAAHIALNIQQYADLSKHVAVVLLRWDHIPNEVLRSGQLVAGAVAACVGSKVAEPVEIALAYLHQRTRSSRQTTLPGRQFDVEALEEQLVSQYLAQWFGLDGGNVVDGLCKVAIVGELYGIDGTRKLVEHLFPSTKMILAESFAYRFARDASLVRKVRDRLETAAEGLAIPVQSLDASNLARLVLVPNAKALASSRLREALAATKPVDARATLESFAETIETLNLEAFDFARKCFAMIATSHTELGTVRPMLWYISQYQSRWYRIDEYYRKAMTGVLGGLKLALQAEYRRWLQDSNTEFTAALDAEQSWVFANAQRTIASEFRDAHGKTAVIIMDALRYEIGSEVANRLGKRFEVSLGYAISSLPSVTEVGMSALVPSEGPLRFETKASKLRVFVNERETNAKSARDDIWERAGYLVIDPPDVAVLAPDAERVAVFHGAVDAIGEKLQDEFFVHVEQLVTDVVDLFKVLADKGFTVIGTADHGFLTLPPLGESGKVAAGVSSDEVKKRRYRVSESDPLEKPVISRTAKDLGVKGEVIVGFAPAASVLSAHGALVFLHGGISLQEMIIPVLRVCAKAKVEASKIAVKFPSRLPARMVPITLTSSSKGDLGKPLRAGIWRNAAELVGQDVTIDATDMPFTIRLLIPEGTPAGEILLKVSLARGAIIEQKQMAFEPDRE